MAIVVVSRWKGNVQDTHLAREVAPVLKKHGVASMRLGICNVGPHAGQAFTVLTFPDWETYGKAMQSATADPEYQRLYAEATKTFELQERSIMVVEDL
jgi:hypothetical protein